MTPPSGLFFGGRYMTRPNQGLSSLAPGEAKRRGSGNEVGAMTLFEEFVLTLLRLGLFQKDLADRFNVSKTTVSVVFNTWICFMRIDLGPLICLPGKEILHQYLPNIFRELYPRTVLIIDAVEIRVDRPSSLYHYISIYIKPLNT